MTSKPPYILTICGRATDTAADGWHERAARYFNEDRGIKSASFEYVENGLLGRWRQDRNVEALASRVNELDRYDVSVLAHSNGCDLACRLLRDFKSFRFDTFYFVAPACDRDFNRNGLNAAFDSGRLQYLKVRGSSDDRAMWAARVSQILTLGFAGYGTLGAGNPKNVSIFAETRTRFDYQPGRSHSSLLTGYEAISTYNAVADWVAPEASA